MQDWAYQGKVPVYDLFDGLDKFPVEDRVRLEAFNLGLGEPFVLIYLDLL